MESPIEEEPIPILPIAKKSKKEDLEDWENGENGDYATPLISISGYNTSPRRSRGGNLSIHNPNSTFHPVHLRCRPSIFNEDKASEKSSERFSNHLIINTQNLADRIQPNNKITSVLNLITKIIACTTIMAFILGVALLTTAFANPSLITIIFCGTISLAAIKAISSISISFGLLLGLRYFFLNSQETLSSTEKPQNKIIPQQ